MSIFALSSKVTLLPVIHGSGDFALEVRRRFLTGGYDALAVPLPPSFEDAVERAVGLLPRIHVAAQREGCPGDDASAYTLVPVEPCQPLIAALREAMAAGIPRYYVDLEVADYRVEAAVFPDPYALKEVALEKFAAALVASLPPPEAGGQRWARIRHAAHQLHLLELDHTALLGLCAAQDWPWLRDAYLRRLPPPAPAGPLWPPAIYRVDPRHLAFVTGELPFITHLYEHRRAELLPDQTLAVDGVKSLILEARTRWLARHDLKTHWLTPQALSLLLKYVRNLTLMGSRLTPDLYTLALAAKQIGGDDFAITLVETARDYPPQQMPSPHPDVSLGINMGVFPPEGPGGTPPFASSPAGDPEMDRAGGVDADVKNRLLGTEVQWRPLPLKPGPPPEKKQSWSMRWDPHKQCSYPPEDARIESFNTHVREQARLLLGDSLARSEKFTSSLKDGLDIRETLRNWHTGDLYVKEMPPTRGTIEIVVFLFDTPADPSRYAWQTTWYAEHQEESTLCFFATDFRAGTIGPGIGQALYGGCFLMFPPRPIPDVWSDPRFSTAETLEERLVTAALFHSLEKRVAVVSALPPPAKWRRAARGMRKQIVHIPLRRFSLQTIDRLRRFHVLNGREVRSYAARYIRDLR